MEKRSASGSDIFSIIIAGVLVWAFWDFMFSLGWFVMIGWLVSCSITFYNGLVFEEPRMVGFIAVGYALGNLAGLPLLKLAFGNAISGNFLVALLISVTVVIIYLRANVLKKG